MTAVIVRSQELAPVPGQVTDSPAVYKRKLPITDVTEAQLTV